MAMFTVGLGGIHNDGIGTPPLRYKWDRGSVSDLPNLPNVGDGIHIYMGETIRDY